MQNWFENEHFRLREQGMLVWEWVKVESSHKDGKFQERIKAFDKKTNILLGYFKFNGYRFWSMPDLAFHLCTDIGKDYTYEIDEWLSRMSLIELSNVPSFLPKDFYSDREWNMSIPDQLEKEVLRYLERAKDRIAVQSLIYNFRRIFPLAKYVEIGIHKDWDLLRKGLIKAGFIPVHSVKGGARRFEEETDRNPFEEDNLEGIDFCIRDQLEWK